MEINVDTSSFNSVSASGDGGAMYVVSTDSNQISLANTDITTASSTTGNGGFLYLSTTSTTGTNTITLDSTPITETQSQLSGGFIYAIGGTNTLQMVYVGVSGV